jgi:hypothetical protein
MARLDEEIEIIEIPEPANVPDTVPAPAPSVPAAPVMPPERVPA